MPTYDYKCGVCGTARTLVLRLTELGGLVYCPKCVPTTTMERQTSAPALVFKGAGWTPKHY